MTLNSMETGNPAIQYRQTPMAGISDRNQTGYCLSPNGDNDIPSITREQYEHLPNYEQCIARVAVRFGRLVIVNRPIIGEEMIQGIPQPGWHTPNQYE